MSPAAISQSENAGDKVSGHPAYPTRFPVQLSPCRDHRCDALPPVWETCVLRHQLYWFSAFALTWTGI